MNGVLVSSHLCMTKDVGVHDNLFGGIMMSWLDEAGAIAAMQYVNSRSLVTVKVAETLFKKPVKAHDVVRIYSIIGKVGRTSITIHLEARGVNLETGEEHVVTSTEMVFVKIDGDGHSVPLFGDDHVQRKQEENGASGDSSNDSSPHPPGTK